MVKGVGARGGWIEQEMMRSEVLSTSCLFLPTSTAAEGKEQGQHGPTRLVSSISCTFEPDTFLAATIRTKVLLTNTPQFSFVLMILDCRLRLRG